VTEVVKAILETGVTLVQLFADTVVHPGNTIRNIVAAVQTVGRTMTQILDAATSLAESTWGRFLDALRDLGKSAKEIVEAAFDLSASALALVFAYVLTWFGIHRPLTADERADAEKVFGTSIDLDAVLVAVLTPPVDLIELVNDQRPFTTMYVINFASWAAVVRKTLVHELTHVWQSLVAGPLYMIQAIHAQIEFGPAAYDYGGTAALTAARAGAASDQEAFDTFNREAQAAIIEDYWNIRYNTPTSVPANWAPYQPYANVVHA
jgi:hypothetical protein